MSDMPCPCAEFEWAATADDTNWCECGHAEDEHSNGACHAQAVLLG